ncbi:iron chelate uptake ABC transporter family permease subunit [Propioniciclava coleopterorum]|uniref:Iron chelate uptake ABC transporter family permease subunit n=1 Tax=Propioniciclava coleopterorum TaxID=2714937 RepID=A0A6G7Y6X0_9ACTN|nr:iron chelate uptake ABC transporter family permease subunit [Propioniciclava coleopterorum]QIK72562.1 iron chelate uptake ABC transporter family permease subunit [Propioniciclava coleopterorum]
MALITAAPHAPAAPREASSPRRSGAFPTPRAARRYWLVVAALVGLALLFGTLLISYANPMPLGTRGFWLIAQHRSVAVFVMALIAVCQAVATVAFQTVTNNRILTPSIMGFESLYRAIQTTSVYLFGLAGLVSFTGVWSFVFQVVIMMALACALYGWLLSGRFANLQVMLLIGIVIGGGLGAVSSFMQRLLTPSEFDVLTARMFGSVSNANPAYFPVAIPLVVVSVAVLWAMSRSLNTLSLGRDAAVNLGVNHRRTMIIVLIAASALIATSTALVGPLTFLGFLVATLAYQFADTFDHRYLFPVAALTGFVVLSAAYFVMNHIFYGSGVVSIIIELVGGTVFLIVILKKGRL